MKNKLPLLLAVQAQNKLTQDIDHTPAITKYGSLFKSNKLREFLIELLDYDTLTSSTPREVLLKATTLLMARHHEEHAPFDVNLVEMASIIKLTIEQADVKEIAGAIKSFEWMEHYGAEVTDDLINEKLRAWVDELSITTLRKAIAFEMEVNDTLLCKCDTCKSSIVEYQRDRAIKYDPSLSRDKDLQDFFHGIFGADLGQELLQDLRERKTKPNREDIN